MKKRIEINKRKYENYLAYLIKDTSPKMKFKKKSITRKRKKIANEDYVIWNFY